MPVVWDVTHEKLVGQDLANAVQDEIGRSQRMFESEMPSVLVVTQKQYKSLMEASGYTEFDGSKAKFLRTKHNVMEIEVKGDVKIGGDND